MKEAVIVSSARTPIGKAFRGAFNATPSPTLAGHAIKHAVARAGIEGTVILIIDVDANGNVTNVSVEKSSRNRDLDRAAMDAARKWRFNASVVNGQKAAGRVRVPVDFNMGG